MKKVYRIISLLLVVISLVLLGGCVFRMHVDTGSPFGKLVKTEKMKLLNSKVVELLDCDVARDPDGAFALLYPDVTDIDTFKETAELIYEYFPITEGYTWELLQWDNYKSSNHDNFMTGKYKVEFDDTLYYIFVTWRYDDEAEGFTQYRVISEKDYEDAQKNIKH